VLDFYCDDARLTIELDGAVHADPEQRLRDADREAALESLGVMVLRFVNEEVVLHRGCKCAIRNPEPQSAIPDLRVPHPPLQFLCMEAAYRSQRKESHPRSLKQGGDRPLDQPPPGRQ
jgi:hypothetical protein